MSLAYSGAEPQPSLAWTFESSNVDIVTGLTPSAQVSPGPAQLVGSAALVNNAPTSNTAVYFPGTTSTWMNLGTSTPVNFDTSLSNIFMECWVYSSRAYNPNFITWHQGAVGGQENWSMYFDTAGNLYTSIWGDVAGTATQGGTGIGSAIPQNTWTHVGFAIANTASVYKTYIYVNGTPTVSNPPAGWVPKFYGSGITQIGGRNSSSDLTNMYIRDLRVVQGGVVPTTSFTPGAAPFSYASPGYVASMNVACFTLLGQFITYNPSGKYGSAISITNYTGATTSYIRYPLATSISVDNGFTTAFWFKPAKTPPSGEAYPITFNGSVTSYTVYFVYTSLGQMVMGFYDGNFKIPPTISYTAGTWYHLTGTILNGLVSFYVNGSLVGTVGYAPSGVTLNTQFYVGSAAGYGGADILMDDLRIYNTALTAAQVQSVYSSQGAPAPIRAMPLPRLAWDFNGTTTDYVTGITPTTITGAPYYSTGKYGQAIFFTNPTTGAPTSNIYYASTPSFTSTTGFTLSFWFISTNTSFYFAGIPVALDGYFYYYINSDGKLYPIATTNGGPATNATSLNTWYHITGVFTNGQLATYLNGTLSNTHAISTFNVSKLTVGSGQGLYGFIGGVDDLRIYDRALTAAQVQSVYNQRGVPGRGVTSKVVPKFTVSDQSPSPLTLSTYGTPATDPNSPIGGTTGSFVPAFSGVAYTIPSSVSKLNFDFCSTTSNAFVEGWVFVPATATLSSYPQFVGRWKSASTSSDYDWAFYTVPASGGLWSIDGMYTDASGVRQYTSAIPNLPLGKWVHVYFGFNGGSGTNGTFYIGACTYGSTGTVATSARSLATQYTSSGEIWVGRQIWENGCLFSDFRVVNLGTNPLPYMATGYSPAALPLSIYPTGTTALLLRSVSPLTMFSGGAIQSATGGDTVQDIGGYRIHKFTTVGTSTFTPASAGNVEVLVVGGGGSGGVRHAGGGGAGGLIYNTSFPVSGPVTVTVGDGGAARLGSAGAGAGNSGSNSVFGSLTAIGGGYGHQYAGGSGGSGGGVWNNNTVGAGTAGQGNNGAFGSLGPFSTENTYGGGGGGGAGAIGTASTSVSPVTAGSGGNGLQISISGTLTYYAGGGGGSTTTATGVNGATSGSGGLGGGGAGGGTNSGTILYDGVAGTNGTGGGGGAGGFNGPTNYASGKGGSGIVIVRYPLPVRLTGAPLFTQLSSSAVASSVGAFSLRAVNGTSAKAVQVTKYTLLEVPPVALTQNTFTATGTFNGVTNGQYVALCSSYNSTSDAYRVFDKNNGTRGATSGTEYTVGTGDYIGSASTVDSTSTTYNGGWFQIRIPSAVNAVSYSVSVHSSYTLTAPYTWKLFGSTTGSSGSWVVLDTKTSYVFGAGTVNFPLSQLSAGYTYFRLAANKISPSSTAGDLGPAELIIYGYSSLVSSTQDFYADRLGNLLTAPVTGQSLASWLGGATGYVTTWYNQIQPGQDVSATVAANQPTIDPVNKTIIFNGSTHSFSNTSTSGGLLAARAGTGTKYTYVARFTPNATYRSIVEHNSSTLQTSQRSCLLTYLNYYGFNGQSNDTFDNLVPMTLGTQYSAVMRVDNSAAGYTANGNKNIRVRSNGSDYSGATGNYATLSLNNYWFTIGRKASNNSEFFQGSMNNIMVFNDALSDADTALLDTWQQSI